jgi:uncharacterized protein YlzI (FlbEa/FlbD family)
MFILCTATTEENIAININQIDIVRQAPDHTIIGLVGEDFVVRVKDSWEEVMAEISKGL